jgi:hypothetical protein
MPRYQAARSIVKITILLPNAYPKIHHISWERTTQNGRSNHTKGVSDITKSTSIIQPSEKSVGQRMKRIIPISIK